MVEQRAKSLIQNILIFGAGTFLTKLVQFCLLPLYTIYLTADAYATGELLNNFSELLYPILTLNIYEAVFRFAMSDEYDDGALLRIGFKVTVAAVGVSALAGGLFFGFTGDLITLVFVLMLAMYLMRLLFAFYARGAGFSKEFAISGIVNAVFLGLFSWILIVVVDMESQGYVLAFAAGYGFSALYLLIRCNIVGQLRAGGASGRRLTSEMIRYSWPLIGYNTAFWISAMSGRYILAFFCGAFVAGVYLAVSKLSAVINMIQQVFFYAFQINSVKEYEEGRDGAYLSRTYWGFSAGLLLFCSLLMCVMPLIGPLVLRGEFSSSVVYLPLALFAAFIDCLFCFFKTFYTAFKETRRAMSSTIVGAVCNVVLSIALVPFFEIWGVLSALVISNGVMAAIRVRDTGRFIAIDKRWGTNLPALCIVALQTVVLSLQIPFAEAITVVLFLILAVFMGLSYRHALRGIARRFRS